MPLVDKGKKARKRRSNANSRHDLTFSSHTNFFEHFNFDKVFFALTNLIKVGKRRRI
jgi:hypothetical protein